MSSAISSLSDDRFRNQLYAKQGAPLALRKEGAERKIISKALVGGATARAHIHEY